MGINLTIGVSTDLTIGMRVCPYVTIDIPNLFLVTNKLILHRDYDLFEQIKDLESHEVNFKIDWYTEKGLRKVKTDPYGDKLRYVLSQDFKRIKINKEWNPWNKAILAFVKKLPRNIKIILYWN